MGGCGGACVGAGGPALSHRVYLGVAIGTHAPVLAGLAVTVSTLSWLPDGLRAMRPEEGLPKLPDFGILLLKGKRPPSR